jgi:hypothetical protein
MGVLTHPLLPLIQNLSLELLVLASVVMMESDEKGPVAAVTETESPLFSFAFHFTVLLMQ